MSEQMTNLPVVELYLGGTYSVTYFRKQVAEVFLSHFLYAEAEEEIRNGMAEGEDVEINRLLPSALGGQLRYAEALIEVENNRLLDGEDQIALGQRAWIAWETGNIVEAVTCLKLLYDSGHRELCLLTFGDLLIFNRDARTALMVLSRIQSQSPEAIAAMAVKASAYIKLNNRLASQDALEQATLMAQGSFRVVAAKREFEDKYQTKFISGIELPLQEHMTAADRIMLPNITPDGSPRILMSRASHALMSKDFANSEANFTKALTLCPTRLDCYLGRAIASYNLKNYSQATSDLEWVMSHGPAPCLAFLMQQRIALKKYRVIEILKSEVDIWRFRRNALKEIMLIARLVNYAK